MLDSHYEAAEQKAAAQFARIVQEWWSKCNHPAPFNIISMPYWALYYCVFQWCSTGCPSRPPERLIDEQDDTGPHWQPTMGHPSYNAALEELKDQIAGQLQIQFGDYEDNGTLIDKAVKVLNRRMEEKIDKMEEKIVNGMLQRQEELMTLINSMAQKPTSTEASARE